ncbi:hypothetical protein MYX78_04180 [Acidobacteria bacterium AH-259-G07]|nr:hypothetical protein [Acidobacteria bacterium AH-259-G07]
MKPRRWFKLVTLILLVFGHGLYFAAAKSAIGTQAVKVSLIPDTTAGPPVQHGLRKMKLALQEKGVSIEEVTGLQAAQGDILIAAGLAAGSGAAAQLLRSSGISPPEGAESLLIRHTRWNGRKALLVSGADERGLMYALLDAANRIGWAADANNPLSEVRDAREMPAVGERALSIYTMHRLHFERRFFDEQHWARFLDMLAQNHFNTFALLFAYENAGYFAPAYPYFFDVEGFPEIHVAGFTKREQQRYFQSLKRLIKMAHNRGLSFTVGLWDHIYRGGVQSGGMDVAAGQRIPGIVTGLTQENLVAYSKAALTKFLKLFPEVDAIQFRMHGESGLKREEMHDFWKSIYGIMNRYAPHMRFDARAKQFPDSLIDLAVDMGVNIRICTKYWAEQMGLPFHPTHVNRQNQFDRRHGYADLLRYPKKYNMQWRLWNGGTSRILLWGDPEYVRHFVKSTHVYDGEGLEVNEMLATKMASQPHHMEPFELLAPKYRYYHYEFERYWHFFQLFGRLSYNPETPPEVWQKEFERRFGEEAAPYVEKALHRASQVLPRINAYNFPYNRFPTTRGWPEKQRREDLPDYARAEGSDIQQFLSMRDAARYRLEGRDSAKIWPQESSEWFAQVSEDIFERVRQAEKRIGENRNKEFISTVVDLKILANLALYHSRRARAGVSYALWEQTKDLNALDDAIRHESQAIQAWEKLVEAAGDVYNHNLRMGLPRAGLSGHWRDELAELKKGLKVLHQERRNFRPPLDQVVPLIAHVPIRRTAPDEKFAVRVTISGQNPITSVRVAYSNGHGKADGISGPHSHAGMKQTEPFLYSGVIPSSAVREGLKYFIEAVDAAGHWVSYPPQGRVRPIAVTVTRDNKPPVVVHTPISSAPAEKPLRVSAQVRDPSGVKWVRLRYRSVDKESTP